MYPETFTRNPRTTMAKSVVRRVLPRWFGWDLKSAPASSSISAKDVTTEPVKRETNLRI